MTFLMEVFNDGAQFSTLNSYRSALNLILTNKISDDYRIKRFFKGIYRMRPPAPKYTSTWDPNIVIDHLSEWFPNECLNLEKITLKLVTLLALVTAHRAQTLAKIRVPHIRILQTKIEIDIVDLIKTSRFGFPQPVLVIPFFSEKPDICPGKTLECYLKITQSLRNNTDFLFLSTRKPYKPICSQTISRWVKRTLGMCGIDISMFSGHSTRHASTSAASRLGVSLDTIRHTAGWSNGSNTFAKFYNRNIVSSNDNFARAILNGCD